MTDLPDEARSAIEGMIDDLRSSGVAPGIDVGEQAPRFVLPDATGVEVALDDVLASGPVVLSFYRGAWCPICNVEIRAQQQILPEIRALGASLVAVAPQAPEQALTLTEQNALGFPVLSDVDQRVIEAYRLKFRLTPRVQSLYTQWGLDLTGLTADGSWDLPVPATFVIAADGAVRARHVDPDYRNRMEPDAILDALRSLG